MVKQGRNYFRPCFISVPCIHSIMFLNIARHAMHEIFTLKFPESAKVFSSAQHYFYSGFLNGNYFLMTQPFCEHELIIKLHIAS